MKEQIIASYNYASDISIFNFANSEFKNRHSIKQYIVVLAADDLFDNLGSILLFPIDYDLVMVNQIMHTFNKQNGYIMNNRTGELWSWHKSNYINKSYESFSFEKLILYMSRKLLLIFCCTIAFAIISCVNGIVVRVALICSNVVIVPMLWVMKKCFGVRESERNTQIIYHSMGIIGAQIANH
jgi:hypothetical protein